MSIDVITSRVTETTTRVGASQSRLRSFDDLLSLTPEELEATYRDAATPAPTAFDGEYDGILLGGRVVGLGGAFPVNFVNTSLSPWKGKVFLDSSAEGGSGGNRIVLGPIRRVLLPFRTHIGPSRFGEIPALHVNYDIPENPAWFRKLMFDELKQLDDDLFLGIGGVRIARKDRFLFTWALRTA